MNERRKEGSGFTWIELQPPVCISDGEVPDCFPALFRIRFHASLNSNCQIIP